jgi:hypothetical protein
MTLQKGDVPHDFPVLIHNGLREKLYFQVDRVGGAHYSPLL